MKSFWSYVTGGEYGIGCTGQSVYVYKDGCETARLKGFQYTYKSCISPNLDYFALKSNVGILYIYSLEDCSLVKKLRFMKADSCQDGMFTFSPTGQELISVDTYKGIHNCISRYSVPTLELKSRIFDDSDRLEPAAVEPGEPGIYALLGERNSQGVVDKYSVALIEADRITKKEISKADFDWYVGFKKLQAEGFAEKAKAWSYLQYAGADLSDLEKCQYSIAKLYHADSHKTPQVL